MDGAKCVFRTRVAEYVYETEEQREIHVKFMKRHGWRVGSQSRRLKPDKNIFNATDEDYEWFGRFMQDY